LIGLDLDNTKLRQKNKTQWNTRGTFSDFLVILSLLHWLTRAFWACLIFGRVHFGLLLLLMGTFILLSTEALAASFSLLTSSPYFIFVNKFSQNNHCRHITKRLAAKSMTKKEAETQCQLLLINRKFFSI